MLLTKNEHGQTVERSVEVASGPDQLVDRQDEGAENRREGAC